MSPVHHLKPVESGQILAEAFTAERQNAIEQTLRDVSSGRNLRGIGGLRVYRGQGTVTIAMRRRPRSGGGGTSLHPFQVTYAGDVGEEKRIRVSNGQIGGITPTLAGGAALDTVPAPTAVITGTGTEYVYAVSEVTHTSTLNYVHNSVIDAIDIQIFTSIRPDDLTGTYYKLLATLVNGVVQRPQPVSTSLNVNFSDDGTASSQAVASYPRA